MELVLSGTLLGQESRLETGWGPGSTRAQVTRKLFLGSWVLPCLPMIPDTIHWLPHALLHLSSGFCLIMASVCWYLLQDILSHGLLSTTGQLFLYFTLRLPKTEYDWPSVLRSLLGKALTIHLIICWPWLPTTSPVVERGVTSYTARNLWLRDHLGCFSQKWSHQDFPSFPVVKIPCIYCGGHGFDPWLGN